MSISTPTAAGLETIIVDKGDFIGGRIATHIKEKENNKFTFFHGAQFFTARSKNFNQLFKCLVK